eukprot:s1261_g32.t2
MLHCDVARTLPIAIGCGNCFIIKPSEKVPLTLMRMAELLKEAGLPPGVLSVVHGSQNVAKALAENPKISAVSFVGSSRVADIIDKTARGAGKRALCMGGAKNHLIAMPDCDEESGAMHIWLAKASLCLLNLSMQDMTISDIMNSAFGSAGQRCMAASILIVVGKGRKTFLEKLVAKAASLKAGQAPGEIGPIIDPPAVQRISGYVANCESQGGKILLDGRSWQSKSPGFWFGPTVLLHQSSKEPAMQDEIFGPVLSVMEVDTFDEAVAIENANPYGNAAAIYTMSGCTGSNEALNNSCAAYLLRTHLAWARFYDSLSHNLNISHQRFGLPLGPIGASIRTPPGLLTAGFGEYRRGSTSLTRTANFTQLRQANHKAWSVQRCLQHLRGRELLGYCQLLRLRSAVPKLCGM